MANYYTRAAFLLPLTKAQSDFALSVLDCACNEEIDLSKKHITKAMRQYPRAVLILARKWIRTWDDYEPGNPLCDFDHEADEDGLIICHGETINTDKAATFCHLILKHVDSEHFVTIEAAHTCSSPRTDGFGGHAAFVTKHGIRWHTTHGWMNQQIRRFEKSHSRANMAQ